VTGCRPPSKADRTTIDDASMKQGNGPSEQFGQGKKLESSAIALGDACAPRKQKRKAKQS
jgi:hypothetical protein